MAAMTPHTKSHSPAPAANQASMGLQRALTAQPSALRPLLCCSVTISHPQFLCDC